MSNTKNKICYNLYYINLEKSLDRRNFMEKQFRENEISFIRIPAIDGDNIKINYRNRCTKKITNGELGCTLSHIKAIKKAFDDNCEIAVICEDDINFSLINKWNEKISDIVNMIKTDWHIIKLHENNGKFIINTNENPKLDIIHEKTASTGLYIINRKSMEYMINRYIINGVIVLKGKFGQADKLIYHPSRNIRALAYNIPLVYNQNNFLSLISKTHNNFQSKSIIKIKKFYENFR
jgi:GR25 family glycosyltransferase involved in LPS biosynthesis